MEVELVFEVDLDEPDFEELDLDEVDFFAVEEDLAFVDLLGAFFDVVFDVDFLEVVPFLEVDFGLELFLVAAGFFVFGFEVF